MIKYSEKSREFYLGNEHISYIIGILQNGHLGQYYFGKKVRYREDFSHLFEKIGGEPAITPSTDGKGFSLDMIKQEYPSYGTGDYREPAFAVLQENGSRIVDFKYKSHSIKNEKK